MLYHVHFFYLGAIFCGLAANMLIPLVGATRVDAGDPFDELLNLGQCELHGLVLRV